MSSQLRVAFQGEPGAFSEAAARESLGNDVLTLPQEDFAGIARAVTDGAADLGMLPVENSIAGGVAGAYDVLAGAALSIVGEVVRPIRLCLLALPGAEIGSLRRVLSHPVALAQCQRFLRGLTHADAIAVHDTAGAARMVAERQDSESGAVAARAAADRYGLTVLAEDIQDRQDNQTRFFIVAPQGTPALQSSAAIGPHRTALLLETAHRAGALVDALTPFSTHGINLTRLESRPAEQPWHYRFFLELDANADEPQAIAAISDAAARAHRLHILGTFRRLL